MHSCVLIMKSTFCFARSIGLQSEKVLVKWDPQTREPEKFGKDTKGKIKQQVRKSYWGIVKSSHLRCELLEACSLEQTQRHAVDRTSILTACLLLFYFISFAKENKTYNVIKLKKGVGRDTATPEANYSRSGEMLRMTIIQEKETNYIQQKIGRDSGRTLLHFKQTVLNIRGSLQSKEGPTRSWHVRWLDQVETKKKSEYNSLYFFIFPSYLAGWGLHLTNKTAVLLGRRVTDIHLFMF